MTRRETAAPWRASYSSKWDDPDYCALPALHKVIYDQIVDLADAAGSYTINPDLIADKHPDVTEHDVKEAVDNLVERQFLLKDGSVVLIRTYFRYTRRLTRSQQVRQATTAVWKIPKEDLRHTAAKYLLQGVQENARHKQAIGEPLNGSADAAKCLDMAKKLEVDTRPRR